MLTAKNITYQVGKKKLLEDVSVTFESKKLNLIIGPNGAGKSTLIKILCNQLQPQSGSIYLEGRELQGISIRQQARIRSVLSQNMDIAFPLTVREIVMMGRYPHFVQQPTKNDEAICNEAMLFFDISPMADRNYLTLSGGEKQRVQFARVAAQVWSTTPECKYLLLDEPLTFLDVFYQFDFMKKVKKIIHDRTIVVVGVVHDLNLASKFADQITLLHSGNVIASGTKEEVLTKDNIKLAYQLEPIIHHTNQSLNLFFE